MRIHDLPALVKPRHRIVDPERGWPAANRLSHAQYPGEGKKGVCPHPVPHWRFVEPYAWWLSLVTGKNIV